jgi:methionyl-tRNA synthetase
MKKNLAVQKEIQNTVKLLNECLVTFDSTMSNRTKDVVKNLLSNYRDHGQFTPKQIQLARELYTEMFLKTSGVKNKVLTRGGNQRWPLDEQAKFK